MFVRREPAKTLSPRGIINPRRVLCPGRLQFKRAVNAFRRERAHVAIPKFFFTGLRATGRSYGPFVVFDPPGGGSGPPGAAQARRPTIVTKIMRSIYVSSVESRLYPN